MYCFQIQHFITSDILGIECMTPCHSPHDLCVFVPLENKSDVVSNNVGQK